MGKQDSELLVETAAHILEAAGGSLPITTLNKALFYLDLWALRDNGATITSTTYLALPAGPVVARYDKRLIAALEDAGLAQQDTSDDENTTKPVCLLATPRTTLLTAEQRAMIQQIGRWASEHSARELSEKSHRNDGWRLAWDTGLGAKKPAQPINLRIAMQQILDIDPWVATPPADDVADAFADADLTTGIDF